MYRSTLVLAFILFSGSQTAHSSEYSSGSGLQSDDPFGGESLGGENFDDLVDQLGDGFSGDEDRSRTPDSEDDSDDDRSRTTDSEDVNAIYGQKKQNLREWMLLAKDLLALEDVPILPRKKLSTTLTSMRDREDEFVEAHEQAPSRLPNLSSSGASCKIPAGWDFNDGKGCYLKALELALANSRDRDFCLALLNEMPTGYSLDELANIKKLIDKNVVGDHPMNADVREEVISRLGITPASIYTMDQLLEGADHAPCAISAVGGSVVNKRR